MIDREKPRGLRRIVRACVYSWQGFNSAWREESAFRQELALSLLAIPAALYFARNGIERAALIAPMLLVLIVEMLNSSLEAIVDRAGTDRHPLAEMAKDMGSAAVLLSFVLGAVWVLILSDR